MRKTLAEQFEPIFNEIQGALLDRTIAQMPHMHYSDKSLQAVIYIFSDVLMSRIWELQEKENTPMEDRHKLVEHAGSELRKLILEMTGVDTHKI